MLWWLSKPSPKTDQKIYIYSILFTDDFNLLKKELAQRTPER
jgi:hypothetical protein